MKTPARDQRSTDAGDRRVVRVEVDGGLPALTQRSFTDDRVVASGLDIGIENELLRYRAMYRLEAGDVFAFADTDGRPASRSASLGGQSFGQNVVLQLPDVAGAPLSLDVTTEIRDRWLLAGETQSEGQRARLEWSPGPAMIDMQWTGSEARFDASLALSCDFESTLKLPVGNGPGHSQALRLSGHQCVIAQGNAYAGTPAQTWGLGYVWSGAAQQSEAHVRMIDPTWTEDAVELDIDPGYQLGLSHRRDFGSLSAKALVSVRQTAALRSDRFVAGNANVAETNWSANASLTWRLTDASLSASWAQGVNPLWFAPEAPEQRDRFGLAVDLSSWFESLAPGSSPELAMRWDWSQVRLPGKEAIGDSSLQLDLALLF
ncbi:MAG TPA: hypothetical protein VE175_05905 [Woeseiaceae bacterium]|nr:hypothetical protein [Woeseiaceae bacterium]